MPTNGNNSEFLTVSTYVAPPPTDSTVQYIEPFTTDEISSQWYNSAPVEEELKMMKFHVCRDGNMLHIHTDAEVDDKMHREKVSASSMLETKKKHKISSTGYV